MGVVGRVQYNAEGLTVCGVCPRWEGEDASDILSILCHCTIRGTGRGVPRPADMSVCPALMHPLHVNRSRKST